MFYHHSLRNLCWITTTIDQSCHIVTWVNWGLVSFEAHFGRSAADRRQVGVWQDFGCGALQRWLGPNRPAHLLGYADAGRLLPHHSRLRGAAREGMAELWSPFPAGKTTSATAAILRKTRFLFSLIAHVLFFSQSASATVTRTTLMPTAHPCLSSLLIACGS